MVPRGTPPGPIWPAWGSRIMESDVDYDIADAIDDECGFMIPRHGVTPEGGVGEHGCRIAFNAGLSNKLFDKYKVCGRHFKRYGGKYYTVVLCYLAMQVGANISPEQIDHAKSVYKSAGLFKQTIEQFGKALGEYQSGKPYEFRSSGLGATLEAQRDGPLPESTLVPGNSDMNHHGSRYFQDGVPTTEKQLVIIDINRPMACDYCGEAETDKKPLLRCGKCKSEVYCSKQCQTNDWTLHKKHCRHIRQPEMQARKGKQTTPAAYQAGTTLLGLFIKALRNKVNMPAAPDVD